MVADARHKIAGTELVVRAGFLERKSVPLNPGDLVDELIPNATLNAE